MATFRRRSGRWQAQIRRDGQCISSTFDTKAAASKWARRIEADLDQGKAVGNVTVHGTVAELLGLYEVEARKLRPLRRSKLGVLKALREGIGHLPVRKLTADQVLAHAKRRREAGAGPVTVSLDLSQLGTVLRSSHALLGKALSDDPVRAARAALRSAKLVSRGQERDRRPTQGEIDRLVAHFRGITRQKVPMWDLIHFAIATAMRREEITRLLWSDLDEQRRTVIVRDRKDPSRKIGNHETIPLLAVTGYDALEIIRAQARTPGRIFPIRAETISTIFARACNALEIADLRFHDLRHEGISRMFEAGMGLPEVALCSGHKTWNQLRRYTQLRAGQVAGRYSSAPESEATPEPPPDDTGSSPL